MSSIQLNGIVGGNNAISVGSRATVLLQQIIIDVKAGRRLILKDINFLFNNEAFAIKVEAQPSPGTYIAGGGGGDFSPNKVLFRNSSNEVVRIFLLVSAVNRAHNARFLSRNDSWRLNLVRR